MPVLAEVRAIEPAPSAAAHRPGGGRSPRPDSSPAPPRWRWCAATAPARARCRAPARSRCRCRSARAHLPRRRPARRAPGVSARPRRLEVRREVRPRWRSGSRAGRPRPPRAGPRRRPAPPAAPRRGPGAHPGRADSARPGAVRRPGPDPRRAEWAIARMRGALGIDHDLEPFHARFRSDPLIGAALRRDPASASPAGPTLRGAGLGGLRAADRVRACGGDRAPADRPAGTPLFGDRAARLRRRPRSLAAQAPAPLASFGLTEARALALVRVAREVASGRVDLHAPDPLARLAAAAGDPRRR